MVAPWAGGRSLLFVVMPDHLHIMMIPVRKNISQCIKAIKGYSARLINAYRQCRGSLWQPGFFDYVLDSEDKVIGRVAYIEDNPLRKGLVGHPEEYIFSSASCAEKMDHVFQEHLMTFKSRTGKSRPMQEGPAEKTGLVLLCSNMP